MTLAPACPSPDHRSPRASDSRLAGLLADLDQLDLHARVVTERIAGEPDVRLQVWRDTSTTTVELLWCTPDAAWPARLDAVRVVGEEREVWRCSHGRRQAADVVRFLVDLLLRDNGALECRYLPLG